MDILQTITLALIQGITEFLPISSSAHLILVPKLTNWEDQGLALDVVVHFGTLTAILFYYRHHIHQIIYAFFHFSPQDNTDAKLGWGLLLATIPVGITGFLFKDFIELDLRSTKVIAYATILFAILLAIASWVNMQNKKPRENINWFDMVFIGFMQVLALVPGTSRSGVVITAGLLIGLSRKLSIKFGFLLAIPVILFSSLLILVELYHQPQILNLSLLVLGFVVSGVSSYLVVFIFIKTIEKIGMLPFVIYRLLLGVLLLSFV